MRFQLIFWLNGKIFCCFDGKNAVYKQNKVCRRGNKLTAPSEGRHALRPVTDLAERTAKRAVTLKSVDGQQQIYAITAKGVQAIVAHPKIAARRDGGQRSKLAENYLKTQINAHICANETWYWHDRPA